MSPAFSSSAIRQIFGRPRCCKRRQHLNRPHADVNAVAERSFPHRRHSLGLLEVAATSSPGASCCMSHLLREKGVLLLPHRPPSLNARPPPFTASLPAGRQCHHSAASPSARLNTGAKVQTAAGSREGSHLQTHAVARFFWGGDHITRTRPFAFLH